MHAAYNEHEIVIEINNLAILKGSLPPKAFAIVMEWAIINQSELLAAWEDAANGNKPKKIQPLY